MAAPPVSARLGAPRRAEKIANEPEGSYPFNRATRHKLLSDLTKAATTADNLATTGLITKAEAELIKNELDLLTAKVSSYRSTECARSVATAQTP